VREEGGGESFVSDRLLARRLLMELDAEDLRKQYVKFQQIQRVVT